MGNTKVYAKEYAQLEKEKARKRKWRKDNPEWDRQWRRNNSEKVVVSSKRWRDNNPEYHREYSKKWKEKNREQYREYNRIWARGEHRREYINTYNLMWQKTDKGKAVAQRRQFKRRTILKNVINTLTSQEWLDILEEHNYICFYCGVEFNCELLPTKDHIIPMNKGGNNTKENITPACRSCNSRKNDKLNYNVKIEVI